MGPHPLTALCGPQLSSSSAPWTAGSAMSHLELLLPNDAQYIKNWSPQCHLLEIYISFNETSNITLDTQYWQERKDA